MNIIAGILIGLIGFFILMQVMIRLKMRAQKGKPAPVYTGTGSKRVAKGEKTILYFFSPSCGACRSMTPVFQKLAKTEKSVVLVDISQEMSTAAAFGIMGTPSVVVVENGVINDFRVGAMPETAIYDLL